MKTLITTAVLAAMGSAEAPKGASGAAVQNTKPTEDKQHLANGETLGEVMTNLDKKDLAKTYELADKVYDIQLGKDGIEQLQGRLKTLENSIGEHVYRIARIAYTHCEGKLAITRSYFLGLCMQAEQHLTSRYTQDTRAAGNAEEKPISRLIPQWPVYKSAIAKGLELGIDPDMRREGTVTEQNPQGSPQYPTASKYKAAVDEKTKGQNGTGSQAGQQRTPSEASQQKTLQQVYSDINGEVQAALGTLLTQLRRLRPEKQAAWAPKILAMAGHVAEMADELAKTPDQRKEVSSEVSEPDVDVGTTAALQEAMARDSDKEPTTAPVAESHGKGKSGKRKGARAA